MQVEDLYASPNALAQYYQRFAVADRVLLTGHSHQAWPDCAAVGQELAFAEAALWVDEKWDRAFAKATRVLEGFAQLLGDVEGSYTLGTNTHGLLVAWLSALPWKKRRRIVTTDGEFHSARRQLTRLVEEGVEVVWIRSRPGSSVGERIASAVDAQTAGVVVSTVFFETGEIAGGLAELAAACERHP